MTFRRFGRDTSGNVAIVFALLFPVLLGGAGLAVDYAYYTKVKGELQGAADAAATAGAVSLNSAADARAAALELAHLNVASNIGTVAEESDVEIGLYDPADRSFTVSSAQPNAVRVTTGRTLARGNAPQAMFSAIWGYEHQEIRASAIAVQLEATQHCIYALNSTAASAFYMNGEAIVSMPDCGVQVNSSNGKAAETIGNAAITSKAFDLVGGYNGAGFNPIPRTAPAMSDPYAHIPEPTIPPCTYNDWIFNSSMHFPAGTRFCGRTQFKGGDFTFAPGTHFFTGTLASFTTDGKVIADGVMFYLGPNLDTRIQSQVQFKMRGVQSGNYAGIAMFQSRTSTTSPKLDIVGQAGLTIDGLIYVPKTTLDMGGGSDTKIGIIVADTVSFRGNSTNLNIGRFSSMLPPSKQSALVQ